MMIHIVAQTNDFTSGISVDRVFAEFEKAAEYAKDIRDSDFDTCILTKFVEGDSDMVWILTRSTKFEYHNHIMGVYLSEDDIFEALRDMTDDRPMDDDEVCGTQCYKIIGTRVSE